MTQITEQEILKLADRLEELSKIHIAPYNLGDMGETQKLLKQAIVILRKATPRASDVSEDELEKMVSELYPLADPRKNMHHDNGGQRAKQEAFKQGYKLHKSNHAEMQKEIERLRSGIKVIEQMSDCGSYELTIVRMKQYATELLTTALTGTKHE